jgi:hypothetical protein
MASIEQVEDEDSGQIVVYTTQKEMLQRFEEYKRETQSGWRCIKSNALFGGFFIYIYI